MIEEYRRNYSKKCLECINLIKSIDNDSGFNIAKTILDALRSKDIDKLSKIDDIIDKITLRKLSNLWKELRIIEKMEFSKNRKEKNV